MILSGIYIFFCLWGRLMRVLEPEKKHVPCSCPEIAANRNHASPPTQTPLAWKQGGYSHAKTKNLDTSKVSQFQTSH